MSDSIMEHFGSVPDDFIPPIYIADEDGVPARLAPWVELYRDKLLNKYHALDLVEPRLKYNLYFLADTILDLQEV